MLFAVGLFGLLTAVMPSFRTSTNGLTFNVLGYSLCAVAASAAMWWTVCLEPSSIGYRILTAGPLLYLGSISYTMYLVHEMALHVARHAVGDRWVAAALAFAGTIAAASGSWYVVERPALQLKDRLFPAREADDAGTVGSAAPLATSVGIV